MLTQECLHVVGVKANLPAWCSSGRKNPAGVQTPPTHRVLMGSRKHCQVLRWAQAGRPMLQYRLTGASIILPADTQHLAALGHIRVKPDGTKIHHIACPDRTGLYTPFMRNGHKVGSHFVAVYLFIPSILFSSLVHCLTPLPCTSPSLPLPPHLTRRCKILSS